MRSSSLTHWKGRRILQGFFALPELLVGGWRGGGVWYEEKIIRIKNEEKIGSV